MDLSRIDFCGKASANGQTTMTVVGRSRMELAQLTFISSTFGTKRPVPAAVLSTLGMMKVEASWDVITAIANISAQDGKS